MEETGEKQPLKEEPEKEKLPLDAKLLSEAVIELNISRRSVGLYPDEHPITRQSIEKAHQFLKKLFDIRSSITLGIAKDVLMVEEWTLDKRNPVFREFAMALYEKGIAAVTFHSGATEEELLCFHRLLTGKDIAPGEGFAECARESGIRHIGFIALDVSKLRFVEGAREGGGGGESVWEDYVYGLMEGKLTDDEAEGLVLSIPPEEMAHLLENRGGEAQEKSYDRVIAAYLRDTGGKGLSREATNRFTALLEELSPEMKKQFLARALENPAMNEAEAGMLLRNITPEDIEATINIFKSRPVISESLSNLLEKLAEAKGASKMLGILPSSKGLIHDIELGEDMLGLFDEDHFKMFVGPEYRKELDRMLKGPQKGKAASVAAEEIRKATAKETLESAFSDILLELADFKHINKEDYLRVLTRLSELAGMFLETGRFEEICNIYNTLYTHMLSGRHKEEANSMVEYFFRTEDFISRLLESLRLWGRHRRIEALRLVSVLRLYLITPLLDALEEEEDKSLRGFFIYLLGNLGSDVISEAVRRLQDKRWYVVRNMIYLIRECGGRGHLNKLRQLAKHKNKKISIEAVRTLLHFRTPEGPSYLKHYIRGDDIELREEGIKLSGTYRVKELLPTLIDILGKKDIFGTETYWKLSAVKALGEIGDGRAIEPLKKLLGSKTLFNRDSALELKVGILRNLKNFGPEAAEPLIRLALSSKDEKLRAEAEGLLKGKSGVRGKA